MEQSKHEQRFKRHDVEMPFHCLTIHQKQRKVEKEIGIHYHEYIEILYSLDSNCEIYLNGKK